MILKLPMAEKATIIKALRELPNTTEIRSGALSNTVFKKHSEVKEFFASERIHFDPREMVD